MTTLIDFFNWKKNPHNVFFMAYPLAVLGFSLHWLYAYLMWVNEGKWGFMVIVGIATVAMIAIIVQFHRILRRIRATTRK